MAGDKSHAEIMLDAIEARLQGRAVSDHERYSIDGRSLDRIPFADLVKLRDKYRREVDAIKFKSGEKVRPRIIRFC